MRKNMTHSRFPLIAASLLFLLAITPLYGEDPAQPPPTEAQPAQEQQPAPAPAAPVQTAPTPPGQTPQSFGKSSPANDAARYLAGLPVMAGSQIAGLTQEAGWQAHA